MQNFVGSSLANVALESKLSHRGSFVLLKLVSDLVQCGCSPFGGWSPGVLVVLGVAVGLISEATEPEPDLRDAEGVVPPGCLDPLDGDFDTVSSADAHLDRSPLFQSCLHWDCKKQQEKHEACHRRSFAQGRTL